MSNIEELLNRRPKRWVNLSIKEFERDIEHLQNEIKDLRESEDWLVKIREDLSDIEFTPNTLTFAVAKPEGIYEMVMELKQLHKETETNLMAAYASANWQKELRKKAEDREMLLEKENKLLRKFIEVNELDLLMEFKDYFPNGLK
ncbi:hypothetical protein [uncultured Metabacillus sp.]|uniref:hypothetical protein n=1 Tax=uncultured Metabacillus sp. TaxID=2860135 RepID=UPI00260DBFA9|nr:hypothetical protein [uncultured Metabacillus sp.]